MNDQFEFFMERLLQYAFDNEIGYILDKKLGSHTPALAIPEKRRMIINMNWYNHAEIPFSVAHEIGHIVNGDAGTLYYNPGSFKQKFEREANLKALQIIMPIYVDANQGIIPDNSQTVIEQLQLPQCLENDVRLELYELSVNS